MQHEEQRGDADSSVSQTDGELAAAYGVGLELAAELSAQLTSRAAVEGAIDLSFERRHESGALLWVVEYGGYLSCWSERRLQEAVGGLSLMHMEQDEQWSGSSLLEHGINFNGYNYLTRETLGQAVIEYLTQQGWQFSQQTLEDPESLMGGFGDDDRPPEAAPTASATGTETLQQAPLPMPVAQPAVPVDRPDTGVFEFEASADPMTKVIFGEHAQHVPAWLYVQGQSNGTVLFVGASRSTHLTWGGTKTHQFMLGELIARPHFVVESNCFSGHGISGLARANHLGFVEADDRVVLCDPMGLVAAGSYNRNMVWQ